MPALNKVLTNMLQSLSNAQKARARANIGAQEKVEWNKVAIDNTAESLADSVLLGSLGVGFNLYYYLDSSNVRLALMNTEGENLSAFVSYTNGVQYVVNAVPNTKLDLTSLTFTNGIGQTQHIRIFVGDDSAEAVVTIDETVNNIWFKIF